MLSDITALKNFEKQKLTEKYKALYLQSLAHDLRTPLNTIICMNEHMMEVYEDNKLI